MAKRFCARCSADVEDVGGFCLLGHRLATEAGMPSLGDLRDQVDKAFEEARLQVAAVLEPVSTLTGAVSQPLPEPEGSGSIPPPPPPPAAEPERPSVWKTLETSHAGAGDPIVAFAPPPRMDWGPQRKGLKRFKRSDADA